MLLLTSPLDYIGHVVHACTIRCVSDISIYLHKKYVIYRHWLAVISICSLNYLLYLLQTFICVVYISIVLRFAYRKVASSRPVYYSIFDYFWGATNWDVLLTETCHYYHVQESIKWWVAWIHFKCRILKNSDQIFLNLYWWNCICKKIRNFSSFCEMEYSKIEHKQW